MFSYARFSRPLSALFGSSYVVLCREKPESPPPLVKRIGTFQYVANKQIEDRIVHAKLFNGSVEFVAVLDGHSGFQVAEHMTHALPKLVEDELQQEQNRLDTSIRAAFLTADQQWFEHVKPAYDSGFTSPIKAGACAVAVAIDETQIVVASVGDCKCVLARKNNQVIDLNIQRNANDEMEQNRLRTAHPGEEDVVRCKRTWQETVGDLVKTMHAGCYVKGRLQPTKSFGDFHLKDSRVHWDPDRNRPFLDPNSPKSFPYIDADPDVTITQRDAKSDQFLIAATDGLWDQFSSEEAVQIVQNALAAGLDVNQAAVELVEAALANAARKHNMLVDDLKSLPQGLEDVANIQFVAGIGGESQPGFSPAHHDGESHSSKASYAFAHAAGIATNEDLKALASRAAQHTSTAQQLGAIASKEL